MRKFLVDKSQLPSIRASAFTHLYPGGVIALHFKNLKKWAEI